MNFNIKQNIQENDNIYELPDQQKLGPGQWYDIHKKACRATNEEKKQHFVEFMNEVREDMRCNKCKDHLTDYMKNNAFRPYWKCVDKDGTEVGMFKWSWILHNSVNTRLGKPYLDWDTARNMYYPQKRLQENSGSARICTQGGCTQGGCTQNKQIKDESYQPFSMLKAISDSEKYQKRPEKIYYKGEGDTKQKCQFGRCIL